MTDVVPAIIPEEFDDIESHVSRVHSLIDQVQVDILDGVYVPNVFTWPFGNKRRQKEFEQIVREERGLPYWEEVDYEIDMMVSRPERFVDEWIQAGAAALIIHYGSTTEHSGILQNCKIADVKCGIAFVPHEWGNIKEEMVRLTEMFDFVQVMGNDKIGHHGVDLDPVVFEIVREIRAEFPEKEIAVDIGVDQETAPRLVEAGVTKLVSGSAIFNAINPAEVITYFEEL